MLSVWVMAGPRRHAPPRLGQAACVHGLPSLLLGWKKLTATALGLPAAAGGEKGPQQAGACLPAGQAWGDAARARQRSLKCQQREGTLRGRWGEGPAHAHAAEHRFPHDCFPMRRITDVCAQAPHPRGQLSLMQNEHHCDSRSTGLAAVYVAAGPERSHS